ncbi:MAG: ATP-binding cassette domain-containing protein [Cyanobacteria bacterium]|nr:ATP-binding cassette domain-containing protein [Cyanobacteriota bacterium]
MPVIRLEHISRIFKGDADEDTRALDDVTVDIARGEYVAVSGPSGCGKSTFLSILGLLDTPSSMTRKWSWPVRRAPPSALRDGTTRASSARAA